MSKTLIIGTGTGGIGDTVAEQYRGVGLYKPTLEELNVEDDAAIEEYLTDNGPFDRIIYSAGVSQLRWIKDVRWRDLDRAASINAYGFIFIAQSHIKQFPEHRVRMGVVVSDASDTPMRGSIAYCMSKAAAEMAVRCMARELYPLFTVVGVSPGVVGDTPMTEYIDSSVPDFRGWSAEEAAAYESKNRGTLGRRVKKREVASALVYAVDGPEALNGTIITINGGK